MGSRNILQKFQKLWCKTNGILEPRLPMEALSKSDIDAILQLRWVNKSISAKGRMLAHYLRPMNTEPLQRQTPYPGGNDINVLSFQHKGCIAERMPILSYLWYQITKGLHLFLLCDIYKCVPPVSEIAHWGKAFAAKREPQLWGKWVGSLEPTRWKEKH